ncbi:TetR/AcrR family transcriptional regulator [Phycicoccus sp. BSK3Z-2]|uniref:TetR/AcrR family transcriptional regulator n=1 Tax=Phycicoccus avicenniae TaxID=2828860 RepID=A0A941D4W7_9MICO|nr:WHG domain-containing protein [Phycicoccus avicenniae]MBR7741751.1 TetR/AcrR family transcriptional regulator [Phycicoccus avicenniae]
MPRVGLTPERLVDAAAEIADTEGLPAVTASAVARRFGVATASVYAHVGGTPDLRTGVCLRALEEMAERLADALAGRSRRAALTALAATYRDYAHEHPGRYAASRTPLTPAQAARSAGPRHAALTQAVLEGYGVDGDDLVHGVRVVGALVHGFVDLEASGSFDHSTPAAGASLERALDGLDAMLRGWAATTTTTEPEEGR